MFINVILIDVRIKFYLVTFDDLERRCNNQGAQTFLVNDRYKFASTSKSDAGKMLNCYRNHFV